MVDHLINIDKDYQLINYIVVIKMFNIILMLKKENINLKELHNLNIIINHKDIQLNIIL